jgi:hypothetical protein
MISMAALAGCAKHGSGNDNGSDVSDAVESHISVINNATSDVNTGNSTAISSIAPAEQKFLEEQTIWQKIGNYADRLFDSSLHATSFSCNSGSVADSGQQFGTSAAFTVTRQWSSCAGDSGQFRRNGNVYLAWTGLSTTTPYVQAGTILERATSGLTMTRIATGNFVDIAGNDSANTAGGANGNQRITWNSVAGSNRSFSLDIKETRTGKTSGGSTRFVHKITTPTPLSITVDTSAGTRTIASGSITLTHQLAGFDVTTTFSNAVWNIGSCQPVSGSATITATGSVSGTGSMTFSNGTINFTFGNASGTINAPGC